MRAALIALTAALGLVDASVNVLTPSWALNKRQAFDPGEDTGVGETCVEAFGPGYVECRPESASQNALCISPAEGHTCCNNECMLFPACRSGKREGERDADSRQGAARPTRSASSTASAARLYVIPRTPSPFG